MKKIILIGLLISLNAIAAEQFSTISSFLWLRLGNISGSGIMAGAEMEASVTDDIAVVVGEDFARKGFTYGQNSFVIDYLEIPFLMKHRLVLPVGSLMFEGGPYISYLISKPPSIAPIGDPNLADVDFGGRLSSGYELPIQESYRLSFDVAYEFGLAKAVKNTPPGDSGRNRSLVASLAFGFKL